MVQLANTVRGVLSDIVCLVRINIDTKMESEQIE